MMLPLQTEALLPSSARPIPHATPLVHRLLRFHTGRQCPNSSLPKGRQRPERRGCSSGRCRAVLEDKGGPGLLDRPDLDLSKLPTPDTDLNFGAGERNRSKIVGGGSYRVVLLDHEKHTEKTVVAAITTVIPGTSPEHALNCYNTAKKLGQAIITSCIKEIAEFYSEQLARQGVRNMIEPDSTVL